MRSSVEKWLESRTGLPGILREFLLEPVPVRLGWPFCLGSMLLFLCLIQVATGLVLALYYSPSPDRAYQSVRILQSQVPLGGVVRGLHYWSAGAMVAIAVLHVLRVIFWGCYKRPREVTWLVGVLLLMVILSFSFTGYLLPWDQRAYWATVVGTRIAGTVPLIGGAMLRILRGGEDVGAATLTRFFAIHAMLLPLLLIGLAAVHLFLLRRHGSSGHWSLVEGMAVEKEPFYPRQFRRDIIASLVVLVGVLGLALFASPGLEPMADPADTRYGPRPEWYFLALFQLLHYFTKHWEIMGTLVIPLGLIALLVFLPWLDRGIQRNPFRRPWVSGITVCLLIIGIAFTAIPGLEDRNQELARERIQRLLPAMSSDVREGYRIYDRHACWICHGLDGAGCASGPGLADLGERRSRQYIADHILDPARNVPRSDMPKTKLTKKDLNLLVEYLLSIKPR